MIRRFLTAILLVGILISCDSSTKIVEVKNQEGVLIERYQLKEDSIRAGEYKAFYDDGSVYEESRYKNGRLVGERKLYYESGALEIVETYADGKYEGPYVIYYENGQINVQFQYQDGKIQGGAKKYFDTGELMEEVGFKDNEENGPFKEYHKNGQVMWEGSYENGDNEVGLLKEFDEGGQLIKKMMCGKYQGEYICQTIWTPEKGDITPPITLDE